MKGAHESDQGEVYNPIVRFVSRLVIGHTATMEKTFQTLAKKFGEQIQVEE